MAERRQEGRKKVIKAGTISFRGAAIDCVVRNLSSSGALLNVESPLGIPTHFLLLIPAESFKRECHITWIKDKQIGVRFNRSTS
jgi:hypothetical protein